MRRTHLLFHALTLVGSASLVRAQCTPVVDATLDWSVQVAGIDLPISVPIPMTNVTISPCLENNSIEFLGLSLSAQRPDGQSNSSFSLSFDMYSAAEQGITKLTEFATRHPNVDWNGGVSFQPCPITGSRPLLGIGGLINTYSFWIGGSGPRVERIRATFTACDSIVIESAVATVIEAPVHISGGVYAAESFGDPVQTFGRAKLRMQAQFGPSSFGPQQAMVESVTVIPEQQNINFSGVVSLSVQPGRTVVPITVMGEAESVASAKSTGLFGLISGAATAGADFPNTITFGQFRGENGAPLPAGIRITNANGTVAFVGALCDSVDFNRDGLFPDTLDIEDFLSVLAGGPCSNDPACGDIDFNNDGLFPDTLDIETLLRVFSGGTCVV